MKFLLISLAIFGTASAQFSSAAQTAIVNFHNNARSKIAQGQFTDTGGYEAMPPAANMLKMKWDATVAASAQKWADTCPSGHSGYAGFGENMYWSWTSAAITSLDGYGTDASASWLQEFADYGWSSTTLDQETWDSGVGHATQMVWAKTGTLGCGVKNCGKDASMNNLNKVVVVCQYKAPGNYMDSDIYQPGDSCSFCPSGTKCETSTKLCA